MSDNIGKQATPHDQLIAEIMDSRVPKNEHGWAAQREIERLRRELADTTAQLDARRNIHRYVAFALSGDEGADVQLAADRVMRELAEIIAMAERRENELRRELAEARGLADALRVAALNADWHDFDALIARLRGGG